MAIKRYFPERGHGMDEEVQGTYVQTSDYEKVETENVLLKKQLAEAREINPAWMNSGQEAEIVRLCTETVRLESEITRLQEAKSIVRCECGCCDFSDVGDRYRCQKCGKEEIKNTLMMKWKAELEKLRDTWDAPSTCSVCGKLGCDDSFAIKICSAECKQKFEAEGLDTLIREGHKKKGGTNESPKVPKPNIKPPAQSPRVARRSRGKWPFGMISPDEDNRGLRE